MKRVWFKDPRRLALLLGLPAVLVCAAIFNDPPRRRWKTVTNVPVLVDMNPRIEGSTLVVSYSVKNQTAAPILVFDQMEDSLPDRNFDERQPDAGWAYVDFVQDGWSLRGRRYRIIVSRRQSEQGLMPCYSAAVPYGDPLEAGRTLVGEFRLPLPLGRNVSGDRDIPYLESAPRLTSTDIGDVELRIGWADELSEFPREDRKYIPTQPFKGDVLWHLDYASYTGIQAIQQIASSTVRPVGRESDGME